jgi:hypothetical protein
MQKVLTVFTKCPNRFYESWKTYPIHTEVKINIHKESAINLAIDLTKDCILLQSTSNLRSHRVTCIITRTPSAYHASVPYHVPQYRRSTHLFVSLGAWTYSHKDALAFYVCRVDTAHNVVYALYYSIERITGY